MPTVLSDIADLFLTRIDDYRITTIYNTSGSTALNNYVEPYLLDSVVEFSDFSNQTLDYTPTSGSVEGAFSLDLNLKNKIILSKIMVRSWLQRTINDILQMQNHVTDRDFRTFSSAQNLSAKREYLNAVKEEISQLLVDYSYSNTTMWSEWRNQIFS